ncbi:hypothetical protein [Paucilactobacillus vaccinostercus]|nr:hypothetical protein [Paucilactobacillus vaccinostercus]
MKETMTAANQLNCHFMDINRRKQLIEIQGIGSDEWLDRRLTVKKKSDE